MTFQEAVQAMIDDKKVINREIMDGYFYMDEDKLICSATHDGYTQTDNVVFTIDDYTSNSWEILEDVIEESLMAYFDEEKRRWISTTNPDKHMNLGRQVKKFVSVA